MKFSESGLAALTSIVIISFVSLSAVMLVALAGIDNLQSALYHNQAAKANNYAQSCVNEALNHLRNNWQNWNDTLTFTDGSCSADVQVSTNATITASGQVSEAVSDLTVIVNSDLKVIFWD